jgi:hypothetical protein
MGNSTSGNSPTENGNAKPKKNGAFQVSQEPLGDQPLPDPATHKYETAREHIPAATAAPAFEDLGELPESYGQNTLFLIARDPHWLFSYWDIDWSSYSPRDGKFYLKLCKAGGPEELATEIHPEARNWYLPAKEAGASYYVEMGFYTASGDWQEITRSDYATTPQDKFSDSAEADFATVPIHLTFQRLVEMVRNRMREGESLISALARLQGEGRRLLFQPGRPPEWSDEQRQVLAALFGKGSAEIDQLLRKELLEKLSTESASELVSKSRLPELLGSMESSLFSAYAAGGLGAAFSSEVTSWQAALGASWSAQPFGQAREFFMHVNAEVIFYGGTHPDAKVWIDGKHIQLKPDGSFRFHFRFPDGNYSIPIVAESPDGVEQRSASLRFERGTSRTGDVGHTPQPENLPTEPMGRK